MRNDVVSFETIEAWYREKPQFGLNDIVGKEKQKKLLSREVANLGWSRTDDTLSISLPQSYIFYGPPDCERNNLIVGFIHDIMDKGYRFIFLDGYEIRESPVDVGEKTINAAFQEAMDNAPTVIFIGSLDQICGIRAKVDAQSHTYRLTAAFLAARKRMIKSGKRVIFIGSTMYPNKMDRAVVEETCLVSVPYPPAEDRAAFLKEQMKALTLAEDLSHAYMAEATDSFNYHELRLLVNTLKLQVREKAIETFAVKDENGNICSEETYRHVVEALLQGKIVITREWFDQIRKDNPPNNKEEIQKELTEFEKGIANG